MNPLGEDPRRSQARKGDRANDDPNPYLRTFAHSLNLAGFVVRQPRAAASPIRCSIPTRRWHRIDLPRCARAGECDGQGRWSPSLIYAGKLKRIEGGPDAFLRTKFPYSHGAGHVQHQRPLSLRCILSVTVRNVDSASRIKRSARPGPELVGEAAHRQACAIWRSC
jgi:hypothetical protein